MGGIDQGLEFLREVDVCHTVEGEECVEMDGVADLTFLGILLRNGLVGHVTTEITVVLEHRAGHGGTEGGIHLTHQHWCTTEGLGHPTGEL